jgi:hypothetical protein
VDATLDLDSDVADVDFDSGIEALKRRMEVLLGHQARAPIDVSEQQRVESEAVRLAAHRERVAAAGGELLGAVFHFLDELVAPIQAAPPVQVVESFRDRLRACTQEDEQGRKQLTLTLPNSAAIDQLAATLARLMVAGNDGC